MYRPGLVSRSIRIMNEHYKGNSTIRFGLINQFTDELLKETFWGRPTPRIVMIKDRMMIRDSPMQDSYNLLHEFIEYRWQERL